MPVAQFSPPLLVVAGFPRTGTTSIYRNLERHPGFVTPVRKELNHFLGSSGPEEYRRHFTHWELGKICVDISPTYALVPETARRIVDQAEDARVVLLLREPVGWIHSVFSQSCSMAVPAPRFSEYVKSPWVRCNDKRIAIDLRAGVYGPTLSAFAKQFGKRLLVADFAAFAANPTAILKTIESFAGASQFWTDANTDTSRNNSSEHAQRANRLVRYAASLEPVIRAAVAILPMPILRRAREYLYYGKTSAIPAQHLDSGELELARAETAADHELYTSFFKGSPVRYGDELILDGVCDSIARQLDHSQSDTESR